MGATIWWYANDGSPKGVLPYDDAVHEEDVDGTDRLTVVCRKRPSKRDKLVWQDNVGKWHEHMVDHTTEDHSGHDRVTVECLNSIAELIGVEVDVRDKDNDEVGKAKTNVTTHLTNILKGTRWDVGDCSGFGVFEIEYYHKRVRECIGDILDETGGELVTDITVGDFGVTKRVARIVEQQGSKRVTRAFTYRRNMRSARREVQSEEVYTAVKGYGAKTDQTYYEDLIEKLEAVENPTDEQKKNLKKFRDELAKARKNEYAKRLEAVYKSSLPLKRWGVPKPDGTFGHHWYIYTDSNCSDKSFMLKQLKAIANAVCHPVVVYRFEIAESDWELWRDVRLGNHVLCIDEDMGDVSNDPNAGEVKRIARISRRLAGKMSCVIEIGERTNIMVEQAKAAERASKAATGNGTKVAAKRPTSTGGNYAAGDYNTYDPTTDPSYDPTIDPTYDPSMDPDYDPETGTSGPRPHAIGIIATPSKLDYYEAEAIDYDGIQVQLLNEDGSVFTDGNYPDGLVPFGELEFPTQYAGGGSGKYATSELYDGIVPLYSMVSNRNDGAYGIYHYHTWIECAGDCRMVIEHNHGGGWGIMVCCPEGGDWQAYTCRQINDGEISKSALPSNSNYTYAGKTVVYVGHGYSGGFYDPQPEVSGGPPMTSAVAWTAVFGDVSYGDETIPVNWTSKYDSSVLTDSFDIRIIGGVVSGIGNKVQERYDEETSPWVSGVAGA